MSMAVTYLLAMRCPVYKQRDFHLGFDTELENLTGGDKGKGASGRTARPKVPIRRSGTDCLVVALKRSNARGAKGAGHSRHDQFGNRKGEEPPGCGGGRQLSLDGTSRVTGDCHARICERLGVKSPGATRRRGTARAHLCVIGIIPGRRSASLRKERSASQQSPA